MVDEEKKFVFHRWLYSLVGILTMIPIIFLTIGQIGNIKKDDNEFAFYILILVQSGLILFNKIYL